MLNYKYEAKNPKTGDKVKAQVQADNEQTAANLIREQGLTPLKIEPERAGGALKLTRIKTKDKILFSRQLATLINAGLPLVQSLRQVNAQTTNKGLNVVINEVINDVEAGTAFSVALEKHPKVFNRVYVSLIAAGETSGTLDKSLERLTGKRR
jgi:type IV pilus assembly protein PilC